MSALSSEPFDFQEMPQISSKNLDRPASNVPSRHALQGQPPSLQEQGQAILS